LLIVGIKEELVDSYNDNILSSDVCIVFDSNGIDNIIVSMFT